MENIIRKKKKNLAHKYKTQDSRQIVAYEWNEDRKEQAWNSTMSVSMAQTSNGRHCNDTGELQNKTRHTGITTAEGHGRKGF